MHEIGGGTYCDGRGGVTAEGEAVFLEYMARWDHGPLALLSSKTGKLAKGRELIRLRAAIGRHVSMGLYDKSDVEQEIWLACFRAFKRYDIAKGNIGTFLPWHMIAAVQNLVRKFRRRERMLSSNVPITAGADDSFDRHLGYEEDPGSEVEPFGVLNASVNRLSERQRDAVRRYYLEGYPHEDIAREMGVERHAVSQMIARVRTEVKLATRGNPCNA